MQNQDQAPIQLLTWGTPNGHKVSILLEELGLKYETKAIDISKNVQKEDWFLKINPNGRIPAIVDRSNNNFPVFESGAIMLYLVEKYDKDHKLSYPQGSDQYWQTVSWLFFQNAGVGPMQGQANHFFRYAPEKIPYAIKRYHDETVRLYGVLEIQLSGKYTGVQKEYLAGDGKGKYTWADMSVSPAPPSSSTLLSTCVHRPRP